VPEACSLVVARCNFYGKKSDKFNSAKEKGGELLAKIEAMEQKCAAPQNLTLREIIETAREIQAKGKEFFSLYIEIVKYPGEAVSPSKIKELNRWFSL
jgi:hypothetical protein